MFENLKLMQQILPMMRPQIIFSQNFYSLGATSSLQPIYARSLLNNSIYSFISISINFFSVFWILGFFLFGD